MKLADVQISAEQIKALTQKYMIETYKRFNFVAEKAKGMTMYDTDGNAYLDFYSGIAVNNAGSCNEKVVAAVRDQAGDLMHAFNYPYSIPQALLAERICTTLGMDKIFYQNSGAEANEAMIKMARKYGVTKYGPEKYHIITAINSFHGRTYGAMSATGQPDNACQLGFKPVVPGFSYARFNDLDDFRAHVTEDTIAIMLEPVQGEGGVIPATQEFLEGIAALCREKGLLLLLDEIQTGWCRTGSVMAYMDYGVQPDIVSMAKGMGGGMPIGAVCATDEVAEAFSLGSHGSTYGGNPVCCAAAYAQIGELLDNGLATSAKKMGDYLTQKLLALPHVKEVRGKGLLIGVVLDRHVGLEVKHGCADRHMLVTAIGTSVVRLTPPLIVSREECDQACDILRDAIEEATHTAG